LKINYKNLNQIEFDLEKYKDSELLIVTKNQEIDKIKELIFKGYRSFGENRVQEALNKFSDLNKKDNIELHLIGPLQTNKAKSALNFFDIIQSIDRFSLVDEIAKNIKNSKIIKTKGFFIQVNIGEESQKSGVLKKNLKDLLDYCLKQKLNIIGLMCIPPNILDPSNYFHEMCNIRNEIDKTLKLSMGMSNDYKIALKFGSNYIRIGSKIFQ
jgi:pyridoxal phosphate enzyme (YggS family)